MIIRASGNEVMRLEVRCAELNPGPGKLIWGIFIIRIIAFKNKHVFVVLQVKTTKIMMSSYLTYRGG